MEGLSSLIIDDVLPARKLNAIRSWAERVDFSPAPMRGIWTNNAPHNPDISAPVLWPADATIRARVRKLSGALGVYPTGTPVDVALAAIKRHVAASSVGNRARQSSAGILASVLRYGPNTGLVWHRDARYYTLGFALYLHTDLGKDGGGMLLLRDTRKPENPTRCVLPHPNRLVIIPPWMEHSVTLVSNYAPDNRRLTLSGFLVRRDQVETLIKLQ